MAKAIEHEVFVNFIGDRNDVMLYAKVPDDRKFLLGKNSARRIVRRVEQHSFGLLFEMRAPVHQGSNW